MKEASPYVLGMREIQVGRPHSSLRVPRWVRAGLMVPFLMAACGPARGEAPVSQPPAVLAQVTELSTVTVVPVVPTEVAKPSPTFEPLKPALTLTPSPMVIEQEQSILLPREISRGNTQRPEIALTFDCGPWVERSYIDRILDTLDQFGARATFFVTGIFIEKHPQVFERIAKTHEVANHSYSHPDFINLTPKDQTEELRKTETLAQQFGATLKPLWRAPFGARSPDVLQEAAKSGYPAHIFWTYDSGDWQDITAEKVRENVVGKAVNGAIVVAHCNSWQTAQELESILTQLQERGFTPTTVSALLR